MYRELWGLHNQNLSTPLLSQGRQAGLLKDIADFLICVPSEGTPRMQGCHILAGHIICEIGERLLTARSLVETAHATPQTQA